MEKYLEFKRNGLTLRGMLHLPENSEKKPPVVILLHGFSGDRNAANFSLTRLSRLLAKNGVASVRFDFLHNGESDGDFSEFTLSGGIADACAMLDFVCSLDEVDNQRIALSGISMGAAIAASAAAKKKDLIHTLCLCCPASNSAEDARNKNVKGIDISDIFEKGYCDIGGLQLGKCYYDDALTLDFYELAKGYDKNVLLVHGGQDDVAPIKNSKKYLEIYGENARLEVIQGADHSFSSLVTNGQRLKLMNDYLVAELLG